MLKMLRYYNDDLEASRESDEKNRKRIAIFSKLEMNYPAFVSIQITSRCNLHCIHCYNCAGETYIDLPYDDIVRTINWMHQNNINVLGITGGEAVLHPQIMDIVTYAADKQMVISLNTNGYAITKDILSKLVIAGIQKLYISIDGREDIHNVIRKRKDSYEKAIKTIKYSLQEKLECEINFTCTSVNFDSVLDVIAIGRTFSVPVNILRFHRLGRGAASNINELSPAQFRKLIHIAEENRDIAILDKCYLHLTRESNCKICHKGILTINHKGDVFLCPYIQNPKLSIGNLRNDSYEKIMNRRKTHPYYQMQSTDFEEPCKSCIDFSSCYGGCRAGQEYIPGRKFEVDALCERKGGIKIEGNV